MAVIDTENANQYKDKYGRIQGEAVSDTITMGDDNDTILGNNGNDSIEGGDGNDSIDGGKGDDKLYGNQGNDTIKGGAGNDYISDYYGLNYLYGDDGDDTLVGRDEAGYFDGGSGNDSIVASYEADTILGGAGNDSIDGNKGSDIINGGKGYNLIKVSNQSDNNTVITIQNGGGSDYIQLDGFSENSITKYIKSTNDLIIELQENDKTVYVNLKDYFKYGTKFSVKGILKAAAYTTLSWDNRADWGSIIKNFTSGTEYNSIDDLLKTYGTYIEAKGTSTGSVYGDKIIGIGIDSYSNDTLKGLQGDDSINGGAGDDVIYGGAGNNTYLYESNDGRDTLFVDKPTKNTNYNDSIQFIDYDVEPTAEQILNFYNDNNKNLVIEYEDTQITVKDYFKLKGKTNLKNILNANGISFKNTKGLSLDLQDFDYLVSTLVKENITSASAVTGGDGFDILHAAKTGSVLTGKKGNDKLYGGKGNDTFKIEANAGHDTIYSSAGQDTIDATESGFEADNIYLYKNGNDLVIYYGNNNVYSDSITFANYFKSKYDCSISYLHSEVDEFEEVTETIENINLSDIVSDKYIRYFTDSTVKKNLTGTVYNDSVEGTEYNDKINTKSGSNIIKSYRGNDVITVADGNNNYINSGSGNNKITVGNGHNGLDEFGERENYEDFGIYADDGNNTIKIGNGNNYLNIGNGNNTVSAKNGINKVTVGDGNNTLTVGNGNNILNLGDGDNTVKTGNGNNDIISGCGNNKITVGNGNNLITVDFGNDTIKAGSGNNTIISGNGDNNITAGTGENQITSGSGNDTIIVGNGNDTILAGDGNNKITAGNGNINITSGIGDDTITVGNGENVIVSGQGYDMITLNKGNNTVTLSQGEGFVTVNQSTGVDKYILSEIENFDNITFVRDDSDALVVSNNDDELLKINKYFSGSTIKDIEFVAGDDTQSITDIAAILTNRSGISKNQKISGTSMNDAIITGVGNDIITSGLGNDTIVAGRGNDTITGGAGINVINFYSGDGKDVINMTDGEIININYYDWNRTTQFDISDFEDKIYISGNNVVIKFSDTDSLTINYLASKNIAEAVNFQAYFLNNKSEFEPSFQVQNLKSDYIYKTDYSEKTTSSIKGSILNDSIIGNAKANVIKAGDGNDYIRGNGGNDQIYGEKGDNTIYFQAGDGKDTVYSGSDKLLGYSDVLDITSEYSFIEIADCYETGCNTTDKIICSQKNNDLIIQYTDSDSVTLSNYYKNINDSKFDVIKINNQDKTISNDIFILKDNKTSTTNTTVNGSIANEIIYCGSGDDTINAGGGNNIIFGGEGDDSYLFTSTADFNKLNQITDISGYDDTLFLDFNHDELCFYIDVETHSVVDPPMEEPEEPVEPPEEPEEPEEEIIGGNSQSDLLSTDLYIMSKSCYGDKSKGIVIKYQFDITQPDYKIENIVTKDGYCLNRDIDVEAIKQYIGTYIPVDQSTESIIKSKDIDKIAQLQAQFDLFWVNNNQNS